MAASHPTIDLARWLSRALLLAALPLAVSSGCSSDPPPPASAYRSCKLNTDCEGSLVCSFGLCHAQCENNKDCPAGQRCVIAQTETGDAGGAEGGAGGDERKVCQLPAEATCNFVSDCEYPLVCAVDRQCRNECQNERDCVSGQLCVHGVCADPSEVNEDGELVGAVDGRTGPGAPTGGTGGGGGRGGSGG
jgi:hypothetical protein